MIVWRLKILNRSFKLSKPFYDAWQYAITRIATWIERDLVEAMIYGGLGITGIAQTPLYQWIISPNGLSQLGIPPSEPPKLLDAYKSSFRLYVRRNYIGFSFGNTAALIKATPHPANGTGKLRIGSWMKWITNSDGDPGQTVDDAGFVPRSKIPPKSQRFIRLNSPLGGLMLPKGRLGSIGRWSLSNENTYADRWFIKNKDKIEDLMEDKMKQFLMEHLTK